MKTPTTSGVLWHARRKAPERFAMASTASTTLPTSKGGAGTTFARSPNRRTTSATARACSTEACRLDLAKMTPMRLAPAPMAQLASSGRRTPQTFTRTEPGDTGRAPLVSEGPIMARMDAPTSVARIKASPTSTPLHPISRQWATSSAVERPLRASTFVACSRPKATLKVSFSARVTSAVRPLSSSKVCRLRLFTPRMRAPAARATLSSVNVTTSTNGSMPCSRQHAIKARSLVCGRIETIRSRVSAP
mmetsp:Transcript_101211/g.182684  ORF Transcript_101211/g.182684 Transcript_101211/m.182684 type:complete len:248 (-) Transcript_101211:561-1304(-)